MGFEYVVPSETGVLLKDLVGRAVALKSLGRVENAIDGPFGSRFPVRCEVLAIRAGDVPVGENLGTTLVFPDRLASVLDSKRGKWVLGQLSRVAVEGYDDREAYVLRELDTEHEKRAAELFSKLV